MKRIKISDAPPRAIDWLVAKVQGWAIYPTDSAERGQWWHPNGTPHGHKVWVGAWQPSTNPAQGHPILDRECVATYPMPGEAGGKWRGERWGKHLQAGPTMLIAGLRCFLVSRLGEEAEVPEELLKKVLDKLS
jgi:hypothetical protein